MVFLSHIIASKEKFFKKIISILNSDCITIKGYKDSLGYVQFQFRYNGIKKNISAHRASYMLNFNKEINKNDVIMHKCDNPSCVNPMHLKKGTHNDNVQDRVKKGRSATGRSNGRYVHGKYCKTVNL